VIHRILSISPKIYLNDFPNLYHQKPEDRQKLLKNLICI
jgi:hypothetical protein